MGGAAKAIDASLATPRMARTADVVCVVTPLETASLTARHRPAWERFVRAHPHGSFFHTVTWMESVRDAFGHEPHYLLAHRGGRIVGVLPLFLIDSILAGRMLVSVPYAVAGGILAETIDARDRLWAAARELARSADASCIELRSETRLLEGLTPIDQYVVFRGALPDKSEDVPAMLPRKARAAARNAERKHGLSSDFDEVHLPVVWRLYCRSMRRLRSLCYPFRFFEALCERSRADSFAQVVRWRGRVVAGLVSFRFGPIFLPYFAGCDERFNALNTNNFLYLSAMRRAVDVGCSVFDFGRSRIDNRGSYDFKRFHGFAPKPLGYQRYVADGCAPPELAPSHRRFRLARRVWPKLPAPLCITLGAWLSRHVPG